MSGSAFEFVTELSIRYRDLDPWNHVNRLVSL
jgi:acyl-CoA thioesterase FadM